MEVTYREALKIVSHCGVVSYDALNIEVGLDLFPNYQEPEGIHLNIVSNLVPTSVATGSNIYYGEAFFSF